MKRTLILSVFVLLLTTFSSANPVTMRTIPLLPPGGARTGIPFVYADYTDGILTIDVSRYAGNAYITISDQAGDYVYSTEDYIDGQMQFAIDVPSVSGRIYNLSIELECCAIYEGTIEMADAE